jgi:putative SOS response-associated peptidase YedK
MCYDISYELKVETILDYLPNIKIDPQLSVLFEPRMHLMAPLYAKAPPVNYPIILLENGDYRFVNFRWDFMPGDSKVKEGIQKKGGNLCNARSEKILNKHSLWYQYRNNRCLKPVTGIFEHREVKGIKNMIPYYVKQKDREMFCIPALYNYSPIADPETGEVHGTFTLITRDANEVMKQIHNHGDNKYRMPLFLPKELELEWLKPELTDLQIADLLRYEIPSENLDYWPVYTIRSSKPRPDNESKIVNFDWPNLPPLGIDEVVKPQTLL